MGRGFQWTPQHTQVLETFMRDGARPLPTGAGERGGYPALHAVGTGAGAPAGAAVQRAGRARAHRRHDKRSGKTRLLEVIACEAIRAPGTVVVIDPKGDVELLVRAAAQARRMGREFRFFSPAFPQASKTFNPLSMCETTTELAARGAGADAGRRRHGP